MPIATLDQIRAKIGTDIGTSDWITVDQSRIQAFADATEDQQFIHVDPAAAAHTPFGGTIAHGFLSLSLLSRMAADVMMSPDNLKMASITASTGSASSPRSVQASACAASSPSTALTRKPPAKSSPATPSPSKSKARPSPR
jgi:hypothetical protein